MSLNTEQLIAQLAEEAAPVRPARAGVVCLKWVLGFAVYATVLVLVAGVREDIHLKLAVPLFASEIMLLLAMVLSSALSAALLSFPDGMQKRRLILLPALMFALFAGVMLYAYLADLTPRIERSFDPHCLVKIGMYSLLPAAWMFWTMRRLASTQLAWAGCTALLAAFSTGALALRLSEETNSILHVMEWHYFPMFGVAAFGVGLGKILLKW